MTNVPPAASAPTVAPAFISAGLQAAILKPAENLWAWVQAQALDGWHNHKALVILAAALGFVAAKIL